MKLTPEHLQRRCGSFVRHALICGLVGGIVLGREPAQSAPPGETASRPIPPAAERPVDFERDVRPILEARCFSCHGAETSEAGLRLDLESRLRKGGDSGEPAVLPGQGETSYLVRLVAGAEPERAMPPDEEPLSDEQIGILRAWIDQGAAWTGPGQASAEADLEDLPWSFQELAKSPPPALASEWCANPVDAFILQGLRSKGLEPSPSANRRTLVRRLYLDALGLPPTPEVIERFESDTRPDAYRRLVEQVLASPHFGERWARHWLDVVRFAESDGLETNHERPKAYHYRDYVIGAMNADLPYDRFVLEQLAGDAVGVDAATGFLVGGPRDIVRSPDITLTKMQRQDELADMVNTTGTAFLGMTIGCARCHNHKFDPISQRDYFAVQAVFAGVRHGERLIRDENQRERERQLAAVDSQMADLHRQLRLVGLRDPINARRNDESFAPVRAKFVRMTIMRTNTGIQPCIDEFEIFSQAGSEAPAQNVALAAHGTRVTASGTYPNSEIHRLEHLHDGLYGNSRSWISDTNQTGWVQFELPEETTIDSIHWGRDREQRFTDRLPLDYRIEVAIEPNEWQLVADSRARLTLTDGALKIDDAFRGEMPAESLSRAEEWISRLNTLRKQREGLSAASNTAYAGRFERPEPTHRLYRGDPLAPREEVAPDALTTIRSLELTPETPEQDRRLALAKWIGDRKNPLTARVLVNRVWQFHFGEGLVDTPSDFGRMGSRPTHPELLDWLASEFVEHGWSMKQLHRLILLSNTYQQSSAPRPEALAIDAGSRALWRYPPRRLESEAIHDGILSVSGTLDPRMHGPGLSTFAPNTNYVRVYDPKTEFASADLRRMVYQQAIRMEHGPAFGPFDLPDAGQPCPKRGRSTTALQSLGLMNSPFLDEQAQFTSERLAREVGPDVDSQIQRLFQLALGRRPESVEMKAASALAKEFGLMAVCRALLNSNEFLFIP